MARYLPELLVVSPNSSTDRPENVSLSGAGPALSAVFGRVAMFFEGRTAAELGALGELRTPSIADLFVAKMQRVTP